MKFFIAFALIAAVASAYIVKPTQVSGELAEIQEIIAAIQSPSTNPATAAALEEMLLDVLGVAPIAVGPAIIDNVSPIGIGPAIIGPAIIGPGDIAVGPAIVDFPLPDGGAVSAPAVVAPVEAGPVGVSPVVIAPAGTPQGSALVQIIVNVNAPAGAVAPGAVAQPEIIDLMPVVDPVQVVEQTVDPVQVVEHAVDPVQVVESPIVVDPVQVVDVAPIVVDPVQVVDVAPIVIEPIAIGTPILPSPAVNLPEELN